MYGKMQESGLTEIFPLICTSALWGHTILFSQMEFPFLRAHCREWLQSDGCWKWKSLSHVWLFATPWIYSPWNSPGQNPGVGSLPGDLPNPGLEPRSPTLQVDSLSAEPPGKPYGILESNKSLPSNCSSLQVWISPTTWIQICLKSKFYLGP